MSVHGLPSSTEIKKLVHKKLLYAKFPKELCGERRKQFDDDIGRIVVTNEISPVSVNIKEGEQVKSIFVLQDLLFQVMLDLGILLSSKIEEKTIAGKKVFNVADGFLIACFDNDVTEKTVKAVAQEKPYYAVFRDSSMANDSVATNFEQIFATYSPETVRKVL